MHYSDDRYHMRVEIEAKAYQLPDADLTRMQDLLVPLGETVQDLSASGLKVFTIHHPRSDSYHVELKLKLPGKTLFTGDQDTYLDSAFQRCVRKLIHKVEDYKEQPEKSAGRVAQREAALERDLVANEGPDDGPQGEAVQRGDYRAFRTALSGYEDWLRKRVGRYPEANSRIGHGLSLDDLIEEVYLNAFEGYRRRPTDVPLHVWLEGLIDPSLKMLLRHPEEERENVSMAHTLREAPRQ